MTKRRREEHLQKPAMIPLTKRLPTAMWCLRGPASIHAHVACSKVSICDMLVRFCSFGFTKNWLGDCLAWGEEMFGRWGGGNVEQEDRLSIYTTTNTSRV